METKKSVSGKSAKKATTVSSKEKKDPIVTIYDIKGKEVETVTLDKALFDGSVHKAALYQLVRMYQANTRQGNAATKTRGDVSGGGKKPFRQKGTGQARAGSTRSPLWRGGGSIFGPHQRDYHFPVPKKLKRLAFVSSLNDKLNEKKLIGLDSIELGEPKTKNFVAVLNALKLEGKSLFVVDKVSETLSRSARNIASVTMRRTEDFNTMDVIRANTVVMTKAALLKLSERAAK